MRRNKIKFTKCSQFFIHEKGKRYKKLDVSYEPLAQTDSVCITMSNGKLRAFANGKELESFSFSFVATHTSEGKCKINFATLEGSYKEERNQNHSKSRKGK